MTGTQSITSLADIPGWFPTIDQLAFEHFLSPSALVPRGDLVELGVYMGKSAAMIGRFKAVGETFTVCDLFGAGAGDDENQRENDKSYSNLDREQFETNYLALFDELPTVVQGPSSSILEHVRPNTARFVHVDASHLYEHVVTDVDSARTMLVPDGVVVFDDFRSAHTPGVSAAVWEAVFNKGLIPIAITTQKLYATFGDPAPHLERLTRWLMSNSPVAGTTDLVAGRPLLRVWELTPPKPATPAPKPASIAYVDERLKGVDRRFAGLERDVKAALRAAKRPTASERALSKARRIARRVSAR